MAHGNSKPVLGSFARGRQARRVDPMRHMLPFSPRSSPPSDPGRSDYLRRVICALRQLATPLDDLGSGMRSRRDLACIFIKSRTLRLRLDCRFGTRAPSGAGEWLSAQIMPRRYQGRPGSIGGDDLGENGGPAMTPKSRGYWTKYCIEFEVVRQIQSFSPISCSGIEPTHSRHVYGPLRDGISLVLGTHACFGRLLYCDRMVRSAGGLD